MKLGISTYSLTWSIGVPGYPAPPQPIGVFDLLDIARAYRIKLVQIADNFPLHLLKDTELISIKEYADSMGIEIEIGTRGTDPDHLLVYLRIANLLGASLCRTLIVEENLTNPVRELKAVLPLFEQSGVRIAVENHGLHTTKQLASLFVDINSPFLGCCLDTVNSFSALDSPQTVIQDLSPYVINLHLKDFDITRVDHQMGFMVLGKPAGYGKLDIDGLLQTVRDSHRDSNVILELWTPFTETVEQTVALERQWLEESLHYLQTNHFSE
ncbi:sugar phosphate isomerase/epimerase family protein [Paenibacillus sp. JDR-2]|uniref:sugar phosphate isomerase/epimerase family protein n=1 Tax=Paenibacillus sp. (strain JDR-2) TaxID=324057 RepID=UPI0001667B45|nr:TIM barrel protein [Paenibacillus sp. JDR-2]ACT02298.1 Xylose isomerase domain protein TIM barrel [Paenibacillus sp. JDR-2]